MDFNGQTPHAMMLLGQLLERSEHTISLLSRQDTLLSLHDKRLDAHEKQIAHMRRRKAEVSLVEKYLLRLATALPPIGILYLFGAQEQAVALLKALAGP